MTRDDLSNYCGLSVALVIFIAGIYQLGALAVEYPWRAGGMFGIFAFIYFGGQFALIYKAKKLRDLEDFMEHGLFKNYARWSFFRSVNRLLPGDLYQELRWVLLCGPSWVDVQRTMLQRFQETSSAGYFEESLVSLLPDVSFMVNNIRSYSRTHVLVAEYLAPYIEDRIAKTERLVDLYMLSDVVRVIGGHLIELFGKKQDELKKYGSRLVPRR